jgi:hypothetical protein
MSGRSSLTMPARARRSRSLAVIADVIRSPVDHTPIGAAQVYAECRMAGATRNCPQWSPDRQTTNLGGEVLGGIACNQETRMTNRLTPGPAGAEAASLCPPSRQDPFESAARGDPGNADQAQVLNEHRSVA